MDTLSCVEGIEHPWEVSVLWVEPLIFNTQPSNLFPVEGRVR